ncbi:hypothetical protein AX15_001720 [Amanita polypyramis BW_CC]|nr:hypothetical protein AX15_001720 [Amanita polypyramis BW_CC]
MSAPSVSIQLPDLPTLTRAFKLRANKACRAATLASEARFLDPPKPGRPKPSLILSKAERAFLPSAKIGLLSGLCFPTCDPSQLGLLTDFMTLLVFAHERLLLLPPPSGGVVEESGWTCCREVTTAVEMTTSCSKSGIEVLNEHELFRNLTPELTAFCSRASATWHAHFSQSTLAYQRAQLLSSLSPLQTPFLINDDPSVLESFISLRRDTSGARIVFDLVEIALGHSLKSLEGASLDQNIGTAKVVLLHALDTLRDLAAEIVALSSDIISYGRFQSTCAKPSPDHLPHNAVVVCMLSKNLSPQGAMNIIVKLLQDKIRSFLDIEHALEILRGSHQSEAIPVVEESSRNSTYSWIMNSLESFAKSITSHTGAGDQHLMPLIKSLTSLRPSAVLSELIGDLDAYLHVLRDYISGNVHWFYETELYFGAKGEEVKAFGWVFLPVVDLTFVAANGPAQSDN